MFKSVLLVMAGSDDSHDALHSTLEIAAHSGASLHILFAIPGAAQVDVELTESTPAEALRRVRICLRLASVERVAADTLEADPAAIIGRLVHEKRADLIVLTAQFRLGLANGWIGSVADKIVRNTTVPVLLLRMEAHDALKCSSRTSRRCERSQTVVETRARTILVPLDGSEYSRRISVPVQILARCWNAHVELFSVVQPVMPTRLLRNRSSAALTSATWIGAPVRAEDCDDADLATQVLTRLAADRLRQKVVEFRENGVEHVSSFVSDRMYVPGAILERARVTSADIIAVTTRGNGASRQPLGSVADSIVRDDTAVLLLNNVITQHRQDHETRRADSGASLQRTLHVAQASSDRAPIAVTPPDCQ